MLKFSFAMVINVIILQVAYQKNLEVKEVLCVKSKLGLASALFLLATLLLKISGMVRDIVIAYYFGDSYVADAYLAAFIIPNMIILFFTTGIEKMLLCPVI